MTISEEKLDELITSLKDTIDEVKRSQRENATLQREMMSILKENMSLRMETQSIGNEELPPKLNMEVPEIQKFTQHRDQTVDENNGNMLNPYLRSPPVRRMKPKRPTVKDQLDGIGWDIFLDAWTRYKKIADLNDEEEICMELREACSEDVNQLIYQFVGATELNRVDLTEDDLLNHIKTVAVKSIHPEVHRWNFNQLRQDEGEGITRYVGRLKSKAALCDFTVKCACNRDIIYSEQMVSQGLLAGLVNSDHQSRVLSEVRDLPDLKSKVEWLVSLETTDDATTQIQTPLGQTKSEASKTSEYRKLQRGRSPTRSHPSPQRQRRFKRKRFVSPRPGDLNRHRECRGCGRASHGNEKTMARRDCPAMGKKCDNCGMENHFTKVCEQRSRSSLMRADDDTPYEDTEDEHSSASDYISESGNEEAPFHHYAARVRYPGFRKGRL